MPDSGAYIEQLREEFIRNLRLDFFDDDEISAILKGLDTMDQRIWQKAFSLCHSLSHASSSLVPNTLKRIETAAAVLSPKDLEQWLVHAYDIFDKGGIGPFLDFIVHIDEEALQKFKTSRGLHLQEVLPLLETFLRGISGSELKISAGTEAFTDTSTVYLPYVLNRYDDSGRNFLLYKIMVSHAWAQIVGGSLNPDAQVLRNFLGDRDIEHPDIGHIFSLLPEEELARDLYTIIEAVRIEPLLHQELPGLMREMRNIKEDILRDRPSLSELSGRTAFVERLYQCYLKGSEDSISVPEAGLSEAWSILKENASPHKILDIIFNLYAMAAALNGEYRPELSISFPLTVRPEAVSLQLKAGRRARKQKMDGYITKLITMPEFEPEAVPFRKGAEEKNRIDPEKDYLLIKGRTLELDSELREELEERGGIPGGILVKGSDIGASASTVTLTDLVEEEEAAREGGGGILYDEWDYKRGGYKKKWCTLYEKDIYPGHELFVESTIQRHAGTISVLRKKFELLKREPKIFRRQKEGDDIDIDAVVEAISDIRAGLSPAENLFTKYVRQERNIAVLFLIDMSGSTKGWINEVEKESLVLLAEALESLGDRYAIYGFSGMTRNKCACYVIKRFDEPYAEAVKRRISGITPKDYTRMGPHIRHATALLRSEEARTKILITLSDGKPEDYDAYKGNYGIEDTRKALIEAKEQGIHSFCITIDKEAASYLRHMYGEVNYVMIDDVKRLPLKITEIYRRLTT